MVQSCPHPNCECLTVNVQEAVTSWVSWFILECRLTFLWPLIRCPSPVSRCLRCTWLFSPVSLHWTLLFLHLPCCPCFCFHALPSRGSELNPFFYPNVLTRSYWSSLKRIMKNSQHHSDSGLWTVNLLSPTRRSPITIITQVKMCRPWGGWLTRSEAHTIWEQSFE